jgi:hypothetical protein
MIQNINLNIKLKVFQKSAPLKILISYLGEPVIKNLKAYYSFENKEPCKDRNDGAFHNPSMIALQG